MIKVPPKLIYHKCHCFILRDTHPGGERRQMNSKSKGARGEREIASILRGYGYKCRRGQQYSGANGDADVVGLPGIHIDVKRREKLNIYDAIDQAKRDAKPSELPTVMHRKNDAEWLVTMPLDSWIEIYREYEAGGANAR